MLIRAVDLFCGAGGLSRGIIEAAGSLGHRLELTAVNHWTTAINSHSLNHPTVRHICEPVENLWPARVIPSRHLHLLAAGVECTYHSNARGGGPCNEQSRSQAWQLVRWMTDIRVDALELENVREFIKWGPLNPRTKLPVKSRSGEFFRNFVRTLEGLGYCVEWRIQCAADFGDPTSRERLILLARRGGATITWPKPTHGDPASLSLSAGRAALPRRQKKLKPWRTARECIDWSLPGVSVFNRKKPLCPNTIKRIIAGLRKFGGPGAEPFIAILNGTSRAHVGSSVQSLDEPLQTVTGANRFYLVDGRIKPFVIGQQSGAQPRTVDKPLPTVAAAGAIRVVQPFITHLTHHGKRPAHSVDKPLPTVTAAHRGEMALVQPFIVQVNHGPDKKKRGRESRRAKSVDQPLPTVTPGNGMALVEPFLINMKGKSKAASLKKPTPTITAHAQHLALVQPFITPNFTERKGQKPRVHSLKKPMPTVTSHGAGMLVEPFILPPEGFFRGNTAKSLDQPLPTVTASRGRAMMMVEPMIMKFYGTGRCKSVHQPLDTVTTKDRFMLVECGTHRPVAELDIRTRMLQVHELALAHSFPKSFIFTGTKEDQTKQIGNSIPVKLARAHARVLLRAHARVLLNL